MQSLVSNNVYYPPVEDEHSCRGRFRIRNPIPTIPVSISREDRNGRLPPMATAHSCLVVVTLPLPIGVLLEEKPPPTEAWKPSPPPFEWF